MREACDLLQPSHHWPWGNSARSFQRASETQVQDVRLPREPVRFRPPATGQQAWHGDLTNQARCFSFYVLFCFTPPPALELSVAGK